MRCAAFLIGASLIVAGCSSSGKGSASGETTSTTTLPAVTTTLVATPTMNVTPSSGLTDGQRVRVQLSGFTAGKRIVVRQCGDANATLPGQCDQATQTTVTVGAEGTATTTFTVRLGPFGPLLAICTPGVEPACAMQAIAQGGGAEHSPPVNLEFVGPP